MNLDINDLMVGDLVYAKDYPMVTVVTKIKPEHFVRSHVSFEPIPLTEEILELNGFKRIQCINLYGDYFHRLTVTETHEDHTYNSWLLEVIHYNDCCECDGDFQYDEILQGEVSNYKLHYVHELQHIMRQLKFPENYISLKLK